MIDWTTVAFQIINFLILLFILKKLLYGRIIAAMDKREADIAARVSDAEQQATEAKRQAAELAKKNEEFDAQRRDLLAKAKAEAEAEHKRLLAQARADVGQSRAQWLEALEREKEGFLQDLRTRVSQHTLAIARRALADLASSDVEARMVESFLAQIQNLDDGERRKLVEAIAKTEDDEGQRHLLVRSAFDLDDDVRRRLGEAIGKHIEADVGVDFATSGEVIGGIEVSAGGTRLAWSIANYLASLEEELAETVEQMQRAAADEDSQKNQHEEEGQEAEG